MYTHYPNFLRTVDYNEAPFSIRYNDKHCADLDDVPARFRSILMEDKGQKFKVYRMCDDMQWPEPVAVVRIYKPGDRVYVVVHNVRAPDADVRTFQWDSCKYLTDRTSIMAGFTVAGIRFGNHSNLNDLPLWRDLENGVITWKGYGYRIL